MKQAEVSCPITKVAKMLSDTWTMLILHYIIEGPQRFSELEKSLPGISSRTLTLKLKKLIGDGLAQKSDDGHYIATKKAKGLRLIENAMRKYEQDYL
jgi:DNA-binding HxlR family transcriptional regulator